MALRTLYEPSEGLPDVPWLKEYLKEHRLKDVSIAEAQPIRQISETPKGYLILTDAFKAFAFGGSGLAESLAEYLRPKAVFGMLFVFSVSGRPALCMDDNLGDCVMTHFPGSPYTPTLITDLDPAHPVRVEFSTGKTKPKARPA